MLLANVSLVCNHYIPLTITISVAFLRTYSRARCMAPDCDCGLRFSSKSLSRPTPHLGKGATAHRPPSTTAARGISLTFIYHTCLSLPTCAPIPRERWARSSAAHTPCRRRSVAAAHSATAGSLESAGQRHVEILSRRDPIRLRPLRAERPAHLLADRSAAHWTVNTLT
jgi:hypothetical protein